MTQTVLNQENIPLVKIDFMNRTHHEEVEMVNSLQQSIDARLTGQQNDAEITRQLTAWIDHTRAHFARENELMEQTGFPAFPVHSEEHQVALSRMQTVVDGWHQNKDIERVKDYVFTLWPNWFITHVSSMDTITAEFAIMNGYTEE